MHAYFCSIIRKRVGIEREAGTKEEAKQVLYLPWMSAVLARGALDYLLPRLSMEGKEPKSLPFFLSSVIHPITEQPSPRHEKFIRHFRHCPTIVRYLDYLLPRNFLLPPLCHDQSPPFFLIPRFFPLFPLFHILAHDTFPPLRFTRLFLPSPSLTAPRRARSPLTPSPSPSPSPSLSFSVWRWPELINNSRL